MTMYVIYFKNVAIFLVVQLIIITYCHQSSHNISNFALLQLITFHKYFKTFTSSIIFYCIFAGDLDNFHFVYIISHSKTSICIREEHGQAKFHFSLHLLVHTIKSGVSLQISLFENEIMISLTNLDAYCVNSAVNLNFQTLGLLL